MLAGDGHQSQSVKPARAVQSLPGIPPKNMPLNPRALEIQEDAIGVWQNDELPAEIYHQLPGASPSQLSQFHDQTDAEARVSIESLDQKSIYLFMGSMAHQMVMEPSRPLPKVQPYPDTYIDSKGVEKDWHMGSNYCKQWASIRDEAGIFHMSRKGTKSAPGYDDIFGMVKSAAHHMVMREVLSHPDTKVEVSVISMASGMQMMIRTRIDLVPGIDWHVPPAHRYLADFKFTQDPSPKAFPFKIAQMGYHHQAAISLDLWNAHHPDDQRNRWKIFAVGQKPPYLAVVHELSPEFIAKGREEYPNLIRRYFRCYSTGEWLGYPAITHLANFPKRFQAVEVEA